MSDSPTHHQHEAEVVADGHEIQIACHVRTKLNGDPSIVSIENSLNRLTDRLDVICCPLCASELTEDTTDWVNREALE